MPSQATMPVWAPVRVKAAPASIVACSPPACNASPTAPRVISVAATETGRNRMRTPGIELNQKGSVETGSSLSMMAA